MRSRTAARQDGRTVPRTLERVSCARARLQSRAAAHSFTLIELLVVLAVMTIMMSIGAGVYFALLGTTTVRGEMRAVMAILQSARNTARAKGCETSVCVDELGKQLYPFGRTKVGVWHFEELVSGPSRTYGAFGHAALATGGDAKRADGVAGNALNFDGTYYLRCQMLRGTEWVEIPGYDTHEGAALEAWVMPVQAETTNRTIISRDGWFGMSLEYDGPTERFALAAFVVTLAPDGGQYLRYSATSDPIIRPNEWTHVGVSCHKRSSSITLEINGMKYVETPSGPAPDPSGSAETTIGATAAGADHFHGRIDQLIISAYAAEPAHHVAGRLFLRAEGLAEGDTVRFDSTGKLAEAHGDIEPKIILEERKGRDEILTRVTITVGKMGALHVEVTDN